MTEFSRRGLIGSLVAAGAVGPAIAKPRPQAAALLDYFREAGPKLLRPAQGPFQNPSIAPSLPGKQYSAELWDWDTLWTARGLFRLADLIKDKDFQQALVGHVQGSLLNFLAYQTPDGRLPILMSTRKQDPILLAYVTPDWNQAKPVMAQLALLVAERTDDLAWLGPVFDKIRHFHDSWRAHNQSRCGLLVWSNDVAIGNDNDPTTFGRPPFSSANLLLNCLFYADLTAALKLARKLGRPEGECQRLGHEIDQLGAAIQKECWDARDAYYYSVDVQVVDRRAELIPNIKAGMATSWSSVPLRFQVFTGFLPLWCGLARPEQAAALVKRNWLADNRLRAAYGVRTLSNREAMYSLDFSSNPSNWLGPVWIISNYFVWSALKTYGYRQLARDLAVKTIRLLEMSLKKDGSLNEYYHPDTGAPLSHKGFMDWNLLVLEMM